LDDEPSDAPAGTAPEGVLVEVGETEIEADDGDTVGRRVRSAYVDIGGDESEARYIHREHVRFEREGDEFYLVNEGRNGTKLNGEELQLDERRAVSDGDEVEFADVTTGTIRLR
jgi:pSer/pThr/pTyr-binding forkhead associated (FHA) protein